MALKIETERLILRDIEEEDIPLILGYWAEPEARENILSSQTDEDLNRAVLESSIAWAKVPARRYFNLAVVVKRDKKLIGTCGIWDVKPESVDTSLGWHYGHEFRGNGYATEAARALIDFAFEECDVAKVFADCFAQHKASIRIFEKIGMKSFWNFGLMNLIHGWSYGENKPTVRYSISRDRWLKRLNDQE